MKGVFTALVTPFDSSGQVDLKSFQSIIEDQIAAGVAGIIPCGTTGEAPTLSKEEKKALILKALELCKKTSVKVIPGTGSNDTKETVEFSKWASDQGAHGVLVVTPYYNKPSQQGMVEHFTAVADAISCELILYNVPGRTAVSLTAKTICKLAEHPRITTIKEASGSPEFTSEILDYAALQGQKIDVLSGDDATFLPLLSVGSVGVISVASNLFPRAMIELQKAYEKGQIEQATAIHKKYYPLFRDLFIDSNPVPIKFAMNLAGFSGCQMRKPLMEMAAENLEQLRTSLKRCGIQAGTRA